MRTVTISVNTAKFTGRVFAKAVAKVYEHIKNGKIAKQQEKEQDVTPHGKQSVKELVSQGQGVTRIEVHDRGIRRFERVARKYGVDYAIKQVKGENKYLVFFKGRDTDALQAALAEYTQQQVPSLTKIRNRTILYKYDFVFLFRGVIMRSAARRLIKALYKVDVVYLAGEQSKPISDAEYCFMYALDDEHPHSQMDISREWLIPKTTINTIAKRWEREGLLIFIPVPGKRREMQISLTDAGKAYVEENLSFMYKAENAALEKTLSQFDKSFIDAIEAYGQNLKEAFDEQSKREETTDGSHKR